MGAGIRRARQLPEYQDEAPELPQAAYADDIPE